MHCFFAACDLVVAMSVTGALGAEHLHDLMEIHYDACHADDIARVIAGSPPPEEP